MSVDVKGGIGGVDSLQKTSDNLSLLCTGLLSNVIKYRLDRSIGLFFGLGRRTSVLFANS